MERRVRKRLEIGSSRSSRSCTSSRSKKSHAYEQHQRLSLAMSHCWSNNSYVVAFECVESLDEDRHSEVTDDNVVIGPAICSTLLECSSPLFDSYKSHDLVLAIAHCLTSFRRELHTEKQAPLWYMTYNRLCLLRPHRKTTIECTLTLPIYRPQGS